MSTSVEDPITDDLPDVKVARNVETSTNLFVSSFGFKLYTMGVNLDFMKHPLMGWNIG